MLPYRKCVVIALRKGSDLLFAERVDIANAWQLPQGGVEENESYIDAAIRELFEETCVSSIKLIGQTKREYKYEFPPRLQRKAYLKYGELKYIGQAQRFVLFDFIGDDSEINLQSQTVEFSKWRWEKPEKILEAVVNFKYDCYLKAFKEFRLI